MGSWAPLISQQELRSSLVFLQHVDASIIPSVYQGLLPEKMRQKTLRKKLLMESSLHALFINVLFASREKTRKMKICNLPYVDAVQEHIIENACQSKLSPFSFLVLHSLCHSLSFTYCFN